MNLVRLSAEAAVCWRGHPPGRHLAGPLDEVLGERVDEATRDALVGLTEGDDLTCVQVLYDRLRQDLLGRGVWEWEGGGNRDTTLV